MTQSVLDSPASPNGTTSAHKSTSERNGANGKKGKNVFPLAKGGSPTYLDNPTMAIKPDTKDGADKVTAARNKNLDLAIQQIAKDYGVLIEEGADAGVTLR